MFSRLNEYKVLLLRIFLAYLFYFFARVLFYLYNREIIIVDNLGEFLQLSFIGLTFDTSAILYVNAIFIIFSLLPLKKISSKQNQRFLFYLYFLSNSLAYATNFFDFIYYKFSQSRLTTTIFDIVKNETNKMDLLSSFLIDYWHVYFLFFLSIFLWIYLYKKIELKTLKIKIKKNYYKFSFFWFLVVVFICVVGMRGGLGNSSRPINMVDAHRFVKKGFHADLVLNSPFCLIRTYNKNFFKKEKFVNPEEINDLIKPIKKLNDSIKTRPNVVLIVLESFGREYIGSFNKKRKIDNYVSYTPFLDSLANHSLIFTNAFANGRQSIEALPSILASLPSFRIPFTSSPHSNQNIQSLVSVFNELDYSTSFFHGAPNGSMGFLGLSNILGFDNYFGKKEFNNDSLYDGYWGIWDEPFFQYMKSEIDHFNEPFFTTLFSLSSHEPFNVPKNYQNFFPKGNVDMHEVIGYSDNALKKFFNSAKKQEWFKNTLFVITSDHCNQFWYPYYRAPINRFAVPILFYHPNNTLNGIDNSLAQQLDIFPSIIDYIGYEKPIKSWGRSLFSENSGIPFSIHFSGTVYRFSMNNFTIVFDGKKIIGVYSIEDLDLNINLINDNKLDYSFEERYLKSFIQDYMQRIIDKNLE
tara:strand:+ start:2197 stop:4107 length:1911 start_codon:yes stop_codon:yes gene_type:complete